MADEIAVHVSDCLNDLPEEKLGLLFTYAHFLTLSFDQLEQTLPTDVLLNKDELVVTDSLKVSVQFREELTLQYLHALYLLPERLTLDSIKLVNLAIDFQSDSFFSFLMRC